MTQRKREALHIPLLGPPSHSEMRAPSPAAAHPQQQLRAPSPAPAGAGAGAGGIPGASASSGLHLQRAKSIKSTIAPGQPAPASRQKDKFVPLPSPDGLEETCDAAALASQEYLPELNPLEQDTNRRGRITLYCIAEAFELKKLDELLKRSYPRSAIMSDSDCVFVNYIKGRDDQPGGDIFFFDYGVIAFWGMTEQMEKAVIQGIAHQVQEKPLSEQEVVVDQFQYNFSVTEKPHVQNDTVTLSKKFLHDHKMKLAVSYALAQSTKLSKYERRVVDIVMQSKSLPESLAEKGKVDISSIDLAKLIGRVFLQKSAVNLLSSVLDTPDFFWQSADHFHALYTRVIEYVELGTRVELLNLRFSVLQEMLDMLRDHENNHHGVHLEWIVIWLILISAVAALFQLLGVLGIIGPKTS